MALKSSFPTPSMSRPYPTFQVRCTRAWWDYESGTWKRRTLVRILVSQRIPWERPRERFDCSRGLLLRQRNPKPHHHLQSTLGMTTKEATPVNEPSTWTIVSAFLRHLMQIKKQRSWNSRVTWLLLTFSCIDTQTENKLFGQESNGLSGGQRNKNSEDPTLNEPVYKRSRSYPSSTSSSHVILTPFTSPNFLIPILFVVMYLWIPNCPFVNAFDIFLCKFLPNVSPPTAFLFEKSVK